MTARSDFTRVVAEWLAEEAGQGTPDYLDETLARTISTRQRPAWSSLERLRPMSTLSVKRFSFGPAPRVAWLLVVLGLVLALGAAAFAVGSRRSVPAPFGPARNGLIVYALPDGDIHAFDPTNGRTSTLVGGPEVDRAPRLSGDGTSILFDRTVSGPSPHQLMAANLDGTHVRPLGPPLPNVDAIEWSPDGTHAAMSSDLGGVGALRVVGLDGTVKVLVVQVPGTPFEALERIHWRPNGRELIFEAWSNALLSFGLYVVGTDGSVPRSILPPATSQANAYTGPTLSPDGTRVAYTVGTFGNAIHVADVDLGQDRRIVFDGTTSFDSAPMWAPDGTKLAFIRSVSNRSHVMVGPATGGTAAEVGHAFSSDAGVNIAFSPDGTKVLARDNGDATTWILDLAGGPDQPLPNGMTDLATWQRAGS
jgi:WD40 repeat protein